MQEIISIEARTLDRMLKKITPLYGLQNIYTADSAKSIFLGGMAGQSGTLHKANTWYFIATYILDKL